MVFDGRAHCAFFITTVIKYNISIKFIFIYRFKYNIKFRFIYIMQTCAKVIFAYKRYAKSAFA